MKREILVLFLVIHAIMLYPQKKEDGIKIYEFNNAKILFTEEGQFLYTVTPCDVCIRYSEDDTVSFGCYKKFKEKAYYLYSSPKMNIRHLDAEIKESILANLGDSILVEISSPFEDEYRKRFSFPILFYQFIIRYSSMDESKIIKSSSFVQGENEATEIFWSHKPTITIPKHSFPQEIEIRVYPAVIGTFTSNFLSVKYEFKDLNSNWVKINFPRFTFQNFQRKYYWGTKIYILSKYAIELDGAVYWRTDTPKRRKKEMKYYYWNRFDVPEECLERE